VRWTGRIWRGTREQKDSFVTSGTEPSCPWTIPGLSWTSILLRHMKAFDFSPFLHKGEGVGCRRN